MYIHTYIHNIILDGDVPVHIKTPAVTRTSSNTRTPAISTASGSSTCGDGGRRGVASPPAGHKSRVSSNTPSKKSSHHKSADHLTVPGKSKAGPGGGREEGGGKERGRAGGKEREGGGKERGGGGGKERGGGGGGKERGGGGGGGKERGGGGKERGGGGGGKERGGGGGGKERGGGGGGKGNRKGSISPYKGSKPSEHKNKQDGKSPNFQDLIKLATQNSGQPKTGERERGGERGGERAASSALPKDKAPSKTKWMPTPAPPSRDPSPSLGRALLNQHAKPRLKAHHKQPLPHKTTPPKATPSKQPKAGPTSGAVGGSGVVRTAHVSKGQGVVSANGRGPITALTRRPLRKTGMGPWNQS